MRKKGFYILLLLAFLLITCSGCAGKQGGTKGADPKKGAELFAGTCAACHGPNAEGLPGLGKNLTTSEFVASQTDEQLLEFIKKGRDVTDPANTTGVAMPPSGGNPALTDEDLLNIIAYIRTLQKK